MKKSSRKFEMDYRTDDLTMCTSSKIDSDGLKISLQEDSFLNTHGFHNFGVLSVLGESKYWNAF